MAKARSSCRSCGMATLRIPNDWEPRSYQHPLWEYLEAGGKRAVGVWHRRAGKDAVALNWAAVAAHQRPATYWHMLPEASQARKAIWEAVNPHTGLRMIDQAFPPALRETTREQEMLIRFKSGSTWQVVGSDNFDSLVGSPPAGVVFSEYALANPRSWAIIRPILKENGGWALFISTPRGRNHLALLLGQAQDEPGWFGQLLPATETDVFSAADLESERREYRRENGDADGDALFRQEYLCSFDAALIGSYYGQWIEAAEREGRVCRVEYDPLAPVHTAWDLGWTDDTAIWWYQVVRGEIRVLEYYENHGKDVPHYCEVIQGKPYRYGRHHVPPDAESKTLASGGKSTVDQARACGVVLSVLDDQDVQDGIQVVRSILPRCWFDKEKCSKGLEILRSYQRKWDDNRKCFHDHPLHNWASHGADAFRYLAWAWRAERAPRPPKPDVSNSIRGMVEARAAKRRLGSVR